MITANCQTCHDPFKGHAFLPYPARHFEMVACQSCHIPRQMGPAEQMVDATLLDESGSPLVMYRGIEGEPANLNVTYTEGSVPTLLPLQESGKSRTTARLTPVNMVSRWYWTSGDSQEPISREVLQQALMQQRSVPARTYHRSGSEPRRQIGHGPNLSWIPRPNGRRWNSC